MRTKLRTFSSMLETVPEGAGILAKGLKRKIFRPRGIEEDGCKYYQEQDKAGDYLSIDPESIHYYIQTQGKAFYEARATAIKGSVSSVCTTAVSIEFLQKKCHRVRKADIPAKWLKVL